MTNLDTIADALRQIGMIAENDTPSPEQGVVGLRRLNQLLAAWGESSMTFPSWFTQTELSATLPLPDWAERAVTAALSIELSAVYERPVSDALATTAANSYDALLRKRITQQLRPISPNIPASEAERWVGPVY